MTPKCYSYIRFSTPEQLKGDSLRRQLKMSEDYARERGLVLDQSLADLGLSAYKGDHRTRGALGRFLALVETGDIAKGSTLIVESLDRLSRQQITEALQQFLDIIRAGVRIVTLADRMEYDQQTINANVGQLIISLTIIARAHEESAMKAKRLRAAWEQKREKIGERKLTAVCPEWLELTQDRKAFRVIPERTEIIRRIYREKLAGKGTERIAKDLNQQTAWLPQKRKQRGKEGWHGSYVQKILRTSAVIGEYQPHKITCEDGHRVRVPVGDPIRDYFPAVVPEELFYAVQQRLEQDRAKAGHGGGRTGKISNLFAYLAKCGYCGSPMAYISKGQSPKSSYLVCDAARRGLGCKRHPIRYDEFEELVLTYCRNLNPADLLPGREEQESSLKAWQGRMATVQGQLKEVAAKVNNLADSIANTDNPAVRRLLEERLAEALAQQQSLQTEAKQIDKKIDHHRRSQADAQSRLASLRELLTFLRERTGEELIDVRRRLREALRGLITRVDIQPVGRTPMTAERAKKMLAAVLEVCPDVMGRGELERLEADLLARIDNRDLRTFHLHFKGGSFRTLAPAAPQPLVLDFDREDRRLVNLFQGLDGETVRFEVEC